jgi:methyl-accepting chemotaxis protein/hemerythrin
MAYHEIVWKPDYEIGITEIDDQHKKLLIIANKFLKAHAEGSVPQVLSETLQELVNYTKYHFESEEKHMDEAGYPSALTHKSMHKDLVNQIVQILMQLKEGKAYALNELANLIKEWLVNHMIKEDRKFGDFISKN